jgi:TDG/mug DNA glycosylase family protein
MHVERDLTGYQTMIDWMGEPVLTLADLWPADVQAMIVGLNPSPVSVEIGHYHQGQLAQRQLSRLSDAGLFRRADSDSTYVEHAALAAGIGFIDVVKRPTCHKKHVRPREIELGRQALTRKLQARQVPLIICLFGYHVRALLGTIGTVGFQARSTIWGAQVFRLPGPFVGAAQAQGVMAQLTTTITAGCT